jgi:hypothetical protein
MLSKSERINFCQFGTSEIFRLDVHITVYYWCHVGTNNSVCSYDVMYLPGYSYGNTPTDNASYWTGMVGVFQRQEADISVSEMSVTSERLDVMDFTLPLHTAV